MRGVSLLWLTLSLLLGCERRVEERDAQSGHSAPAIAPSAAPGATGATAARATTDTPRPERCVRTKADAPKRPTPPTGPDPRCPSDPDGNPALRRARVIFEATGARLTVEVAEQDGHRMRGLMYRTSMADDRGMLFVFERRTVQRFWMKNTCIPLDMLFIDQDGLIVGIEENVPTLNTNSYQAGCPSLYVLEVNAGWCANNGVEPGQRVRLEGL